MKDKAVENYIKRVNDSMKQLQHQLLDFQQTHPEGFLEYLKSESTKISLKNISSYVKPEK